VARSPRLTLLIDADILVYRESAAAQKDFVWENGATSRHLTELDDVKEIAEAEIARLVRDFKADQVVLCFTDTDGNFRKRLYPHYKGTRREKPEYHRPLMEHLMAEYRSYWRPGLEGDDCLGILATHPSLIPGRRVVVSADKDMKTIPCTLHNPQKGTTTDVSEHDADRYHFLQTLTGDPTDEYPGCPGVGPVKAERALDAAVDEGTPWANPEQLRALYWKHVVAAYEARGLTEEDALLQARCARILRHTDYNFTAKEPILWTPPT
jgi:DNA polymerase-1